MNTQEKGLTGSSDRTIKECIFVSLNEKSEQIIDLHYDNVIRLEILKGENQFLNLSKDFSMKLFDLRKNKSIYIC